MKKIPALPLLAAAICLLYFENRAAAQGFAWGPKGGLTIGQQKWDGSLDRDLLFKYHGSLFIESLNEENPNFSLFAEAGYHVKGSAVRYRFSYGGGAQSQLYKREYRFENIGLTLGGKKRVPLGNLTSYYTLGLRGEFNVRNNLAELSANSNDCELLYLPNEQFVKKIVGGFSLGAGIEFPFAELVGGFIELTVQPDFSRQYFQPPIPPGSLTNPCSWNNYSGAIFSLPERQIRNIALELSAGFRFLRKVEYVD